MTLINRYAYLILAAAVLFLIWRLAAPTGIAGQTLALAAGAVGLVVAWVALRPAAQSIRTVADLERRRASGRPLLLDFVSPF